MVGPVIQGRTVDDAEVGPGLVDSGESHEDAMARLMKSTIQEFRSSGEIKLEPGVVPLRTSPLM